MSESKQVANRTCALRARYPNSRALSSLGYRQAIQLLNGELSREQAIAAAQQAHRNYAKRQLTWFRREPDVHWLAGFGDDPNIQSRAIDLVEAAAMDGSRPPQPETK